jgi:hypothetical protein
MLQRVWARPERCVCIPAASVLLTDYLFERERVDVPKVLGRRGDLQRPLEANLHILVIDEAVKVEGIQAPARIRPHLANRVIIGRIANLDIDMRDRDLPAAGSSSDRRLRTSLPPSVVTTSSAVLSVHANRADLDVARELESKMRHQKPFVRDCAIRALSSRASCPAVSRVTGELIVIGA